MTPNRKTAFVFKAFGLACLLFLCYLLFKYLAFESRQNFTSDEAVLNLLAREIYQHGSVFPRNWITTNGDLMLPSGTLIVAPLLHFFPNSFELHAVVSVVLTLVFLIVLHWVLKAYSLRSYYLPMALFASGISIKYTQMVFLQTTYFWWVCAFFLTIAVFAKRRFAHPCRGSLVFAALVSAAVSLSNPGRAMLMYAIPSMAFIAAYHWPMRASATTWSPLVWRLGAVLFGWFAASVTYYSAFRFGLASTVDHAAALQLTNAKQVHANLVIFLNGWVDYLGMDPAAFGGTDLSGFYLAICASLIALFSAAAVIWWLGTASTEERQIDFYRAMGFAFFASFVPVFILYVFFVPLAVNAWTIRYFTTPLSILFFVSTICVGNWLSVNRSYNVVITTMLLVFICWTSYIRYQVQAAGSAAENSIIRVSRELPDLNIHKGYATYWNASSVTVLSFEKVKVRPLELLPSGFRPYPVMVSRNWYVPDATSSFLLLTDGEAAAYRARIEDQFGEAARIVTSNGYQAWIYEYDLVEKMPSL
ncbi:hypothetical protein [Comamonas odontotermitis]|uniref:hypothetical protein n=1 Tax=Comamonas odontotermitis TaxID=379895 RepID=UPI00374FE2EF